MLRLLLALSALTGTLPLAAQYGQHPEAQTVLSTLEKEFGFNEAALARAQLALRDARTLPQLIVREQTAPERTETWTQYARRLDAARVSGGLALIEDHGDALARVEDEYGVPPAIVAAVLGIETRYGRITGNVRVLDALATQGFDHPTRGDFFRRELVEFLVFCEETGRDPRDPRGSYAGAMGAAQFMPSNYRRLAVDFDGDGQRDLWQLPDAIGSIGRYFIEYRPAQAWKRGEPLMVRATVRAPLPESVVVNHRTTTLAARELAALGVVPEVALPPQTPVGIIRLPLDDGGFEYWVGLSNFYAVMTYNPRTFYAMAVAQLADQISTARAAGPAPR